MITIAHHPKMKLSLTNRHISIFEWRIPSRFFNETSSNLNLKNFKNNYK